MTYCTACVRQLDRPLLGRVTDTPSSCCARSRSLGGSSRCQTANTSRNRAAVLRSGNKCFAIIGTAHVVIGAGSMRRYGVRPSVRQSLPARAHSSKPAAAGLLLWARRAGDIDRLLQQRRAPGKSVQCHVVSVRRRLKTQARFASLWRLLVGSCR